MGNSGLCSCQDVCTSKEIRVSSVEDRQATRKMQVGSMEDLSNDRVNVWLPSRIQTASQTHMTRLVEVVAEAWHTHVSSNREVVASSTKLEYDEDILQSREPEQIQIHRLLARGSPRADPPQSLLDGPELTAIAPLPPRSVPSLLDGPCLERTHSEDFRQVSSDRDDFEELFSTHLGPTGSLLDAPQFPVKFSMARADDGQAPHVDDLLDLVSHRLL
mmetsp:Transcript_19689/g.52576  ORF Transcript_19689/g.52576 Transcript_19689/m.52576 type:complete len:217 (-) Transcript_19689:409-1059(-)